MNLDGEKMREVHDKLREYERDSMAQLVSRYGNHGIDTASLSKEARDRLVDIEQDDVEKLWSLRLSGKERVWGVITGSVFSLLWWDPEHTVYLIEKRNT
jgi:hypothetical protein